MKNQDKKIDQEASAEVVYKALMTQAASELYQVRLQQQGAILYDKLVNCTSSVQVKNEKDGDTSTSK